MSLTIKILILVILPVTISCNGLQHDNKELAKRILTDKTLDSVYNKATDLLKNGFAAGDGYPQLWICDLNTFIYTSCDVYDTQIIRQNLLTFFKL